MSSFSSFSGGSKTPDSPIDAPGRLVQQWRLGQRPDVSDYLSTLGPLSPLQLVAVLRVDQRERWRTGERVPAEHYLRLLGQQTNPGEEVLDLIYSEFLLRQELGETPSLEEYQGRFPQYAEQLQLQIHLHRALEESPLSASSNVSGMGTPLSAMVVLDPEQPPVLAGYEILGELGRGGMGVVYKARQVALKRLVALKMIRSGGRADRQELARFRSEAEAVARLQHPNIVQIHEIGAQDGRPFFSLELIEGGSLTQKSQGLPQPARPTAELLEKLARAMHYAHQQGIVHRDLKPANVLLTADGVPKITDFGLAKQLQVESDQTQTGTVIGTPSYMAPEQARGDSKHMGRSVDVYALGAILYEQLTGQPPFRGLTPLDTLDQVCSKEPVPPHHLQPKVPRDLETICLKCLQKEPHKRYSDAAELAEDLHRFLHDEPIRARPVGSGERLWRWGRRHPGVAVVSGLLAAVLIGSFAGLTVLWLRAEDQRRLAEEQRGLAVENARRAEANLKTGRRAVWDSFIRLSDVTLEQQFDKQKIKKELLEPAVAYFQAFLAENQGDPDLEAEVAEAHFRVGQITRTIGSKQKALDEYQQALAGFQKQARARPADANVQVKMAQATNSVGTVWFDLGRMDDALRAFQQARVLWEQLSRSQPGVPRFQQYQAQCCYNIGVVHANQRQTAEARHSFQEALAIQEKLPQAHPQAAEHQNDLASTWTNLAFLERDTGRAEDALRSFDHAFKIREQLARRYPSITAYQSNLADCHSDIGHMQMITGRLPEARHSRQQALAIREKVAAANPSVTEFQSELAASLQAVGKVQLALGQSAAALESFRQAHAVVERLAAANPDVPRLQLHLAGAHLDLGHAQRDRGEFADSLRSLQAALAIQDKQAQANPAAPDMQCRLAKTINSVGVVQQKTGQPAEALRSYQRAAAIQEKLTRAHPDLAEYADDLASTYCNLGTLKEAEGQPAAALQFYQQALVISEKLARDNPAILNRQQMLAGCYVNAAGAQAALGNRDLALQSYQQALAIREQLVRAAPGRATLEFELASSYSSLGLYYYNSRQTADALRLHQQALALLQKLAQANPENLDYRSNLGGSWNNLAKALEGLGRREEARKAFHEAIAVQREAFAKVPQRTQYRRFLSNHYNGLARVERALGRPAEAAAATLEKQKLWPNQPAELYAVAGDLARCIPLVGRGKEDLSEAEKAERQQYADQAMAALRQAIAQGFQDAKRLQQDKALEPLRRRADFQQLVSGLEKKVPPNP